MPTIRPLALALGFSLISLLSATDADAARKKKAAAPKAPAVAAACTNFYDYANASWLKANPVPQAGAVTALGQLSEHALQQQRELLDASMNSPQGNVQKLLGDFWASGLDEAAVEKDGSNPIAPCSRASTRSRRPRMCPLRSRHCIRSVSRSASISARTWT